MARYAISLFLRETEGNTVKERLQLHSVKARNKEEALGLIIRDEKRQDKLMPIVFHCVMEIPR